MSEIHNRTMGFAYDEDRLQRELGGGTSGYDVQPDELLGNDLSIGAPATQLDNLKNERMQWNMIEALNGGLSDFELAERTLLEAEIIMHEYEEKMSEVAIEHPIYTWHVGKILSDRLDTKKAQGHPVDAEMYLEAQELAEEIVAANPDKNPEELSQIVTTMVNMIQAECRVRLYTLAA